MNGKCKFWSDFFLANFSCESLSLSHMLESYICQFSPLTLLSLTLHFQKYLHSYVDPFLWFWRWDMIGLISIWKFISACSCKFYSLLFSKQLYNRKNWLGSNYSYFHGWDFHQYHVTCSIKLVIFASCVGINTLSHCYPGGHLCILSPFITFKNRAITGQPIQEDITPSQCGVRIFHQIEISYHLFLLISP